ncbi:MAG: hypothetical protein M1831_000936 [Alyxoria varia]|nr:MAG: hypothetical protein M1831_000936 [Alyxoria varia]
MSQTNLTPAVVIIHGAWATPESFSPFIELVKSAGYVVECPLLPTCNGSRPPNATRADDVAVVRSILDRLIAENRPILPIMHSYGGVVGSEALTEDYTLDRRSKIGLSGGIGRLIFVTAFLLDPGVSIVDTSTRAPNYMEVEVYEDGAALLTNAAEIGLNDLPPPVVEQMLAAGSIPTFNSHALQQPSVGTPWQKIPTTYVHCDMDRAIQPQVQEGMVEDALNHGGIMDLVQHSLHAAHNPCISKPKEVLSIVNEAWESVRERHQFVSRTLH